MISNFKSTAIVLSGKILTQKESLQTGHNSAYFTIFNQNKRYNLLGKIVLVQFHLFQERKKHLVA